MFGKNNEIPAQWLSQLMQILSADIADNIAVVYLYNPNTHLRSYLKKAPLVFLSGKLSKRIVFAATLAEIQEHIHSHEIKLPDTTSKLKALSFNHILCSKLIHLSRILVGLETEPNAVFFPVYKLLQFRTQMPLSIKVSAEYVQIMTVRKQDFVYGLQAIVNDVYHISEIDQITLIQHDPQGTEPMNEFSFKTARDNVINTFISPKREAIINVSKTSDKKQTETDALFLY